MASISSKTTLLSVKPFAVYWPSFVSCGCKNEKCRKETSKGDNSGSQPMQRVEFLLASVKRGLHPMQRIELASRCNQNPCSCLSKAENKILNAQEQFSGEMSAYTCIKWTNFPSTSLRLLGSDLCPVKFTLHTAWRRAQSGDGCRRFVESATLQRGGEIREDVLVLTEQ